MNKSTSSLDFLACAVAAVWLLGLTVTNLEAGGTVRGTLFYALPVILTAWRRLDAGFFFAGASTLSAWASGALSPQPALPEPIWIEGMWAFLKLSAIALGVHVGRRFPGRNPQL